MNRRDFLLAGAGALAAPQGREARIRLITRGDDLGCARSLNRAMKECYEKGILKNCSVLAPAPHLEEAAKQLAGARGLCFGLHCCLTSEWDNVRWGPVAPKEKVPSLLDRNGHLHQTNEAVWASAKAGEALLELQAQLDRARRLGFDIKYADVHMGTALRVPGLADKWADWCRGQGILDTRSLGRGLPGLPSAWNNPGRRRQGDYVAQLIEALRAAPAGEYLIVGHPAYDDAETRRLGHEGYPGDSVAHNLNWERLGFTDPRMARFCREQGVQPIRYDEAGGG